MAETVMVPVEWAKLIDDFLTWMTAGGRSSGSVHLRRLWLTRLARTAPAGPAETTADQLATFLATPGWAPETRRSAASSLRGLFGWAVRAGRLECDPTLLLASVRAPAGQPRPIPDEVLNEALRRAEPSVRLMLLLAAFAGLRRSEIACVHTRDVANGRLRIRGKGGRVRDVPLHPVITDELAKRPAGYVFPGKIDGHLSADRVGHVVARALPDNWTAHTLRHRFASSAYAVERDLLAVQELLGHSAPETTRRYTAVPEGARERAVQGLPCAFAERKPRHQAVPPLSPATKAERPAQSSQGGDGVLDDLALQRLRRAVDAADRNSMKAWLWMFAAGLSPGEIGRLRMGDVMLTDRQLLVGGPRARVVRIPPPLVDPLTAYLVRVHEVFGSSAWGVRADDELFFWDAYPNRTGRLTGGNIESLCCDHLRRCGIRNATAARRQLPALL